MHSEFRQRRTADFLSHRAPIRLLNGVKLDGSMKGSKRTFNNFRNPVACFSLSHVIEDAHLSPRTNKKIKAKEVGWQ